MALQRLQLFGSRRDTWKRVKPIPTAVPETVRSVIIDGRVQREWEILTGSPSALAIQPATVLAVFAILI